VTSCGAAWIGALRTVSFRIRPVITFMWGMRASDCPSPFTRAQALAAGVSPQTLRSSRVRRLFRGVYMWADEQVTPVARARAALALHDATAFASHHSAARLHGLPAPPSPDEHVSVFDIARRRPQPGIRVHLAASDSSVVVRHGIRVAHPIDTFLELANHVPLVDLVSVGDATVRRQLASPAQLLGSSAEHQRAGCVLARRAAALVRPGVDSPMETRLRMLIVLAGLPEPVVNHAIRAADGRPLRRFDLCYPSWRLIVEYDGRQHAEDGKQWRSDIVRREELDRAGWRLVVVTAEGIYTEPERTLRRVVDALSDRGCTLPPLSDEWRPHFART